MSCNTYNPCKSNNLSQVSSYAATAGQYAQQAQQSATNAATSATQASTAEAEAQQYAIQAATSAAISGIYLGAKSTAPVVDNQGNPLQEGMQYFNSVDNTMYVWDGTSWITATGFNETTNFLATGTTTARDLRERFADVVNVLDFIPLAEQAAIKAGTSTYDATADIQAAIDSYQYAQVFLPFGKYVIKGQIIIKEGSGLYGSKQSFDQGPGTNISLGPDRYKINEDSMLSIEPNDINLTPIVIERNGTIKGVSIIYPNQDPASLTPIQYATTIQCLSGSTIQDIRFWGAYNFIDGQGEALRIQRLYGWTYGCAIKITNSSDVGTISDIHLNPNVVRPPYNVIETIKSNIDSVAFYFENVDGWFLNNILIYGYRTGLKIKGGAGSNQTAARIDNFFFDAVGLAFDIDSDSTWGFSASNATVVCGFTDDSANSGLVNLRQKTISNTQICEVTFANIVANSITSWGGGITSAKSDYSINIEATNGYRINLSQITVFGAENIISETNFNIVNGEVNSGSSIFNLSTQSTARNHLKNNDFSFIYESIADGTKANFWNKDGLFDITKYSTGLLRLESTGVNAPYKGFFNTIEFDQNLSATIIVKAKRVSGSTGIWVKAWDAGFTNLIEKDAEWISLGSFYYSKITFTSPTKKIYRVYINPGAALGDYVDVEWAAIVQSGSYLNIEKPENFFTESSENTISGTNQADVIPPYIGALFRNTTTGDIYIAKNTTSPSDWVLI